MKVLSIDPGYDRLGIAVMEATDGKDLVIYSNCITTDKTVSFPERIQELGNKFVDILNIHSPNAVALETLFFNKNIKTAIQVAQARGALLYLAKQHHCRVFEFGPQEIKIAVTGYGNSDKKAVTNFLQNIVDNLPTNGYDDEYDAIAVGVTYLAHYRRFV